MEKYILILPIAYIVLFLIVSVIKHKIPVFDRIIFCPMCSAYFLLLIIGFIFKFPPLILSFMVGMTIVGSAGKLDDYLRSKKKEIFAQSFLIQLFFTLLGLLIIVIYLT